MKRRRVLFLSTVYVPDPASVGQHYADAAEDAARRGFAPIVLTARSGYENPAARYLWTEKRNGVRIIRLPFASFGKRSMLSRIAGGMSFTLQCMVLGLLMPRLSRVVVTTAPPQLPLAAIVLRRLRRIPFVYWVMDLNPDQAIALGAVRPDSLMSRLLSWVQRRALLSADIVVTLDRFMVERIHRYGRSDRVVVLPPWPHDDRLETVPHDRNPFRTEHHLQGRFVVMYSGNHGVHNPLDTVVEAARILDRDASRITFVFIGGGVGWPAMAQAARELSNVVTLPYQPLASLRFSLSAADVHVVSLMSEAVGVSHPCKVYGAMAVGRPVLFLGPSVSHVSDIMDRWKVGWRIEHGDVAGLVNLLRRLAAEPSDQLEPLGSTARAVVEHEFSRTKLLAEFSEVTLGAA